MMEAGQELDAIIAEKVMGLVPGKDFGTFPEHEWMKNEDGSIDIFGYEDGNHNGPACVRCYYDYCHHCQDGPTEPCEVRPPLYSTTLETSFEVLAMTNCTWNIEKTLAGTYYCAIDTVTDEEFVSAEEKTIPLAICRAVLRYIAWKHGNPILSDNNGSVVQS